jgi:hypothetical protein
VAERGKVAGMASTKGIVTTAFRWAATPVGLVIALNIQNRATEAGYGRISLRNVFRSKDMTDLYNMLTSDLVWGSALFLAGMIVFSWLYYWLERSEGKQGSWARTSLAGMCENAAKWLERPGINRWFGKPRRFIPMLNKRLSRSVSNRFLTSTPRTRNGTSEAPAICGQFMAPSSQATWIMRERLGERFFS